MFSRATARLACQVGYRHRFLPQSSSASRFTAGASGFFILSQSGACSRAATAPPGTNRGPLRYSGDSPPFRGKLVNVSDVGRVNATDI
jgi:hypothetical protein